MGWNKPPIVFLLLFVVLIAPTAVFAQSADPDRDSYLAWAREALTAAERGDRLGLEASAERMAGVTSIRLDDGAQISVDNTWLHDSLRQPQPDLQMIAARLGAIVEALAQPPGVAPPDARDRLQAILNRPPFIRNEPEMPRWLLDLLDWIGRMLDRLLRPVQSTTPASQNLVAWAIGIGGTLLLLGVIVYLLIGLRRGIAAEAHTNNDDPEANLTAREALDQASELARGGDYRSAVRYLYLSALLRLDERGLLRYDRTLTNREYLERVRDNPGLRARLGPIVDIFDQVWYGHVRIDADTFARYREQVEALRSGKES